jgi:hypothetical protein
MTLLNPSVYISATWLLLTLIAALYLDATSVRGWLLATTVGIVPVGVLLRLWNAQLSPTIAEVLYATERR